MGYELQCTGIIRVKPYIEWGDIKNSPFLPDGDSNLDVMFMIEKVIEETEDGQRFILRATGVVQRWESDARNSNIIAHLQRLVNLYPNHEFVGHLSCEGEAPGDIWRLEVKDRKVTAVIPRIVWPDGSEYPHPRASYNLMIRS